MKYIYFFFGLLFLIACDKKTTQGDLCEGVVCKNGGVCQNGDCQCPPNYTGPACQEEVPPIRMIANQGVTLSTFPKTDPNGGGWDVFDAGDIFFVLKKGTEIVYESTYIEDLQTSYTWSNAKFIFDFPKDIYTLQVWDYDDGLSGDDFVGGITFQPYQNGLKFPETLDIQCNNCVVSFKMKVSYQH